LIARLDRLGSIAKEIGQMGSVIGRDFGYDLIEEVARRPTAELRSGLDRLVEGGLLFCRGTAPQSSYLFKHALVQDAAYSTLLRARRRELHARVSAVLEQHFANLIERQPELLAHHLTAAGDTERAVDQWLKAGQHAAASSAHLEAIGHFERGLSALAALPEGPGRDGREIELQLARGLSLFTAKGYISAEAAEAYSRAREIAEARGDARQLFTAVFGLWISSIGTGQLIASGDLSNRLLLLTATGADEGLRLQAHHSAWTTCLFGGDPAATLEHCEAGRRLYDPERHGSHRLHYGGHDPGVCGRFIGGQAYWLLGYPQKGLALAGAALALAERIAHPFSLDSTLLFNGVLYLECGDPDSALRLLGMAETLATEQRLGLVVEPRFMRGAALSAHGELEQAVACLREGLAGLGAIQFRPYALARLAEALARQGEHDRALATVRDGLKILEESGHRQLEGEFHRLEGIALLGLNRIEEGQNALEAALRVARKQQAKAYELRAATSLALLWGEQSRRAEARELLAPVYGWFTEGLDTGDLKEAKALLEQLA
jgi:tetratricopeptide (TPR) repeat protein